MNTKLSLERLIRETIPLSDAMRFEITTLEQWAIKTYAPLDPNVNIHGTAFAGSLYSLAMLTAWGLVTHCLSINDIDAELVAYQANMDYQKPVTCDIVCAAKVENTAVTEFLEQLHTQQRAKLDVQVSINEQRALMTVGMSAKLKAV